MDFRIEKYISNFIENQFPKFYQEEGENFILFVKAYYEWLESDENPVGESRRLLEYRDIDTVQSAVLQDYDIDKFLLHFQQKYLYGIPFRTITSKRFLLKHILDVYRSKGTIQCYRLLFKLVYGEDIQVYLPGRDILRASDGIWYEPKYLEMEDNVEVLKTYVGKKIVGVVSGTTAVVENYVREVLHDKNSSILYISNILPVGGDFEIDEPIVIEGEQNKNSFALPRVLGSLDHIEVVGGGQGFLIGDTFIVPPTDIQTGQFITDGVNGLLRVKQLARNLGSTFFSIKDGGFGFSANSSTFTYNNLEDLTGSGASFDVGSIISPVTITYNTDILSDLILQGKTLDAASYGFSGNASANLTSTLATAFSWDTNAFGVISSLTNIKSGNGYTKSANCFVRSLIQSKTLPGSVTYSSSNTRAFALSIYNPGSGYNNTDIIRIVNPNVGGTNATASVVTDGSGKILTANLTNYGTNFTGSYSIVVANSSGGTSSGSSFSANAFFLPYITGTTTSFTSVFSNDDVIILQANSSLSSTKEEVMIKQVINATSMFLYDNPVSNSTASALHSYGAVVFPSSFAAYESIMYNIEGDIYGKNESILASYKGGNNSVSTVTLVDSGKGYIKNQLVKAYIYGAVSNNITIVTGGTGYKNNESLVFTGGSPNAPATGYITTNSTGGIISTTLTYAGSGYNEFPTIVINTANGQNALLTASLVQYNTDSEISGKVVLRGYGKGRGYWLNTQGFLNSDKYIQDSYYYQDYSYEIKVARTLDKYKDIFYTTFHPSGSELFGNFLLNEESIEIFEILDEPVYAEENIINYSLLSDSTTLTIDTTTITVDQVS